jgi:hypothetical protein
MQNQQPLFTIYNFTAIDQMTGFNFLKNWIIAMLVIV